MKTVIPLGDIVNKALTSQNDPGQFTPRLHKDGETLEAWKKRALGIAVKQISVPIELNIQEICKECCEDILVDPQHVNKVFEWLRENNFGIHYVTK